MICPYCNKLIDFECDDCWFNPTFTHWDTYQECNTSDIDQTLSVDFYFDKGSIIYYPNNNLSVIRLYNINLKLKIKYDLSDPNNIKLLLNSLEKLKIYL